jgi:hypothetical protein
MAKARELRLAKDEAERVEGIQAYRTKEETGVAPVEARASVEWLPKSAVLR